MNSISHPKVGQRRGVFASSRGSLDVKKQEVLHSFRMDYT